jgi:TolB-like protein/DNA-binding winged helix-turn-helix (wHTH) protein/Tfp pilus assembly protein PilF
VFLGTDMMSPALDPMRIGEWLADPRDDSLSRGNERVKLEPRTMRLLMRLALTPGAVVSQDQLLESVWSGVVVGPASVYQSMSQLRKVLGDTDDPPRYIETVARKGYRLVATVSSVDRSAFPPPPAGAAFVELPAGSPAAVPVERRRPRWRWAAMAVAVVLVAAIAWWQMLPLRPGLPQSASIVVLPFTDLTDGRTQQMFCDGLTEETSNWLAQIPSLRVVARSSAFAYRDRQRDVRAIGRELNTSHVLEGSLRRSGNRIRITVQLIDTNSGFNLWSESYNEEVGDVLRVQEDVARKVAGNLELRISADTDSRFAGRRSKSGPAQELYLNARAHANKLDSASNELAITLYRQALHADPGFSLAKVYLARAISNRRYFNNQRLDELLPEVLPLFAEAEKASPGLMDIYVQRGGIYVDLKRRELAQHDLKRAMELNPNSAEVSSLLGWDALLNGRPRDALSYYTITAALDPRDFVWQGMRCIALSDMAQFVEAETACAQARKIGPNSPWVFSISSSLEAARGRMDEALRYSRAALERDKGTIALHAERARWLRRLGLMKEAGVAYREAMAADSAAVRRSAPLLFVGATVAIDTGGAPALRAFLRETGLDTTDNPTLLFEAANAWLMVGDHAQARACIDRAMATNRVTNEDLESAWFARTGRSYLLIDAMALRAAGENTAADRRLAQLETLLARMVDAGVRTEGLYELKAQLSAVQGRPDDAMSSLRRSVELGWSSVWLAEHEPYFATLKDRSDFRGLIAEVRARNASTAAKLREQPPLDAGGNKKS